MPRSRPMTELRVVSENESGVVTVRVYDGSYLAKEMNLTGGTVVTVEAEGGRVEVEDD